eukprot:TRINITY_DN2163_c0_g1_i3.p1 TRINITY_DN2163_c0_g1~~TRINITY_DN2163_c0_g1_i3.p1  ORF type:complete len:653 (-),score=118.68 TRINITY_DN2163_c0_g1_i3:82-2040(-)
MFELSHLTLQHTTHNHPSLTPLSLSTSHGTQLVKSLNAVNDIPRLREIVKYITDNFTSSPNGNNRKGGLIALAAVSIGLGQDVHRLIEGLCVPVLKCFVDSDNRVRYYACEAMYNIAKVGRGRILPFFNDIFDGLCKLSADPDVNVKNGSQLLDRLVKDVVTESETFDIEKFVPKLAERIYCLDPFVRQFLISWINVLDSVPDIDLLDHLPKFLDGLFTMLSENQVDIRLEAENTLAEFLRELQSRPNVDFSSIFQILLPYCESMDEHTRLTAITWVDGLIKIGNRNIFPLSAQLVGGILPCLSHEEPRVQKASASANHTLLGLVQNTHDSTFPIGEFLTTVIEQFLNNYVPTRLAALRWVLVLHQKAPAELAELLDGLLPALLKTLSDPSDDVVRLNIEVMAKISSQDVKYFQDVMQTLIQLFGTDPVLLENRGTLIVRHLCVFIAPEKIYTAFARIVENEEDLEFAGVMVQTLNIILLTSAEVFDLRASIRTLEDPQLFSTLYRSWCHNPAATLSLCLLGGAYEHASALVLQFALLEVTVGFLVEIDKLVQLLESPIFTSLRLHLLEPHLHPYLVKCLYGLLMLLPQSTAFETLRSRLDCVCSLSQLRLIPQGEKPHTNLDQVDFTDLMKHFVMVQQRRGSFKRKDRLKY